jgi:hypothetical protein
MTEKGAVTSPTMHVTESAACSLPPHFFFDVCLLASSSVSRSKGTDDRHALDPGINAVMMSSSSELEWSRAVVEPGDGRERVAGLARHPLLDS